jgi:rhodanese-related sulfurtransferase
MTKIQKYHQIMSRDLPSLLQQGAVLVDVRRTEEWQMTGVVVGSHLLTFFDAEGNCQPEQWHEQLNRMIPADLPLVLICRTGYRTTLICEMLLEMCGRDDIYNVTDGIFGWLSEGFPVVPIKP